MNAAMMPQGLGFPHISASRQSAPVLFTAIGFVWSSLTCLPHGRNPRWGENLFVYIAL